MNIRYNSEIVSISQEKEGSDNTVDIFTLKDSNDTSYRCKILIIRYCLYKEWLTVLSFVFTGMWVPNIPENFSGIELAEVQQVPY